MYTPTPFREDRLTAQHALIRARPFGLLVSCGPDGPMATSVPFLLDPAASPLGTLCCHLARPNPQWRTLSPVAEVLVVFTAADAYVTPTWYASKRQHGRVVPTWNYVSVQARGRPRLIEDRDWLAAHVTALTELQESSRPHPWAVGDAPESFVEAQLRGIVGVAIDISRLDGKVKASQNRPAADRAGVADGLESEGGAAAAMARFVRQGGG